MVWIIHVSGLVVSIWCVQTTDFLYLSLCECFSGKSTRQQS